MRKELLWLGIGMGAGVILSLVIVWYLRHPK